MLHRQPGRSTEVQALPKPIPLSAWNQLDRPLTPACKEQSLKQRLWAPPLAGDRLV